MSTDPVVLLAEELRSTEIALNRAVKIYNLDKRRKSGEEVIRLLSAIKSLNGDLYETTPTSASGAGELVHFVAERLPFAYAQHALQFHEIGDRLGEGQRTQTDLIWLRSMHATLARGMCGEHGVKVAPLLKLAILGAAQPVVIFRQINPVPDAYCRAGTGP